MLAIRGGSQMYDNTTEMCTSAFTVENGGGTRGQVTAAHCLPFLGTSDKVDDKNGTAFGATTQAIHHASNGDVGWFTTLEIETAVFWSDSNNHRHVNDLKTNFSRNDLTCVYGRTSDDRECDQVYRTSVSVGTTIGTIRKMVLADGDNGLLGGDSGGGWSFGTEAQGITSGTLYFNGATRGLYSKAHRVDNALGVDIRVIP